MHLPSVLQLPREVTAAVAAQTPPAEAQVTDASRDTPDVSSTPAAQTTPVESREENAGT